MHLDLDGAWPAEALAIPTLDVRLWGPRLRISLTKMMCAPSRGNCPANQFGFFCMVRATFITFLPLWHSAADTMNRPIRVVCFDNHPDWDIRPPRWACGAWVNRALESVAVERVSVWGCGNFEMNLPHRWFRNRAAMRQGRLEIFPWMERQSPGAARRFPGISRADWQARFEKFAEGQSGAAVYVTVDMDCLREEDAATDWEPGLFSAQEVAWAIDRLRQHTTAIFGDVCGASSRPVYARPFQRFAGWWDHPSAKAGDPEQIRAKNVRSIRTIWPALTGLH